MRKRMTNIKGETGNEGQRLRWEKLWLEKNLKERYGRRGCTGRKRKIRMMSKREKMKVK